MREVQKLIQAAKARQHVVLHFAGHGCQQPNQMPAEPNDPDGIDEIFLPADIDPSNAEIQTVRNAIVDGGGTSASAKPPAYCRTWTRGSIGGSVPSCGNNGGEVRRNLRNCESETCLATWRLPPPEAATARGG